MNIPKRRVISIIYIRICRLVCKNTRSIKRRKAISNQHQEVLLGCKSYTATCLTLYQIYGSRIIQPNPERKHHHPLRSQGYDPNVLPRNIHLIEDR